MAYAERPLAEILVPGLFPASSEYPDPSSRTAALTTLLARSDRRVLTDTNAIERLMHRYGLASDFEWPAAALSLLADGGRAEGACWLRADPVHLRVHRDQLILGDSRLLAVSRAEAEACNDALNRHFADEGFVFYPLRPERWYLRVPALPAITTFPLSAAIGRHIDPLLPKGPDALAWHRIFNEAQMLLHGLPINETREASGQLPINSVWLWGAGALPAKIERPYSAIVASDPVVRGLALAGDCTVLPTQEDIRAWLDSPQGELLVFDDAPDAAQAYGDDAAWSAALEALERNVFAPLLGALQAGHIEKVRIVTFAANRGLSFETTRTGLWRFWRGARPLSSFALNS